MSRAKAFAWVSLLLGVALFSLTGWACAGRSTSATPPTLEATSQTLVVEATQTPPTPEPTSEPTQAPLPTPEPAPTQPPAPATVAVVSPTRVPAPSQPSGIAAPIRGYGFPYELRVSTGATVVWTNFDDVAHDVTASDGSWGSTALAKGQSFARTFAQPGRYAYVCKLHPYMAAVLIVE